MLRRGLKCLAAGLLACILAVSPVMAEEPVVEPQGTLNRELKRGVVDNNGVVDANDALEALKVVSGLYTQQEFHLTAGDINQDGKLSVRDALIILQNTAKLVHSSYYLQ